MIGKKIALYLALGFLALAFSASVAYSSVQWATCCNVWTTDSGGTPKGVSTPFNLGETVYIHWDANGQINLTVYAPDGTTKDHEWSFLTNSTASFLPNHGNGIYTIVVPSSHTQWPIAVGGFETIPQLPVGTIMGLGTMIVSVFFVRKIRAH